ncbi:MAG: hypothetical protein ACM3JL_00685 [Nitrososphaerota archaeon]
MSEPVETPEGPGRLKGAAQVIGGWRVRVELAGGGTWTGSADELSGDRDKEAFERLKRKLETGEGHHR